MEEFDSEADRRDSVRKQIVDHAYNEILRILSASGATRTPQERAYLQSAILKRLVQAMYLDLQMGLYREEIQDRGGQPPGMTHTKFLAYVRIQISGVTNMNDVNAVVFLSGGELTREDCYDIRKNYAQYREQWPVEMD